MTDRPDLEAIRARNEERKKCVAIYREHLDSSLARRDVLESAAGGGPFDLPAHRDIDALLAHLQEVCRHDGLALVGPREKPVAVECSDCGLRLKEARIAIGPSGARMVSKGKSLPRWDSDIWRR